MRASEREQLVSRVLEVAVEAVTLEDLAPALPHLSALFGASNAMMYRTQPDQPFTFVAGASDCLPEYTAHFAKDDPIHRALGRDDKMVVAGSHAAEWRELRGRRALADFYDRWELSWLLHVRLSRAGHLTPGHAAVAFGRTRRQADFGRDERRAAEVVLPALTAAARRAGRLARHGVRMATVEALLEAAHGRAILALDLDGALRWSSPRAERLIGACLVRGALSEVLVAAAQSVASIARRPFGRAHRAATLPLPHVSRRRLDAGCRGLPWSDRGG